MTRNSEYNTGNEATYPDGGGSITGCSATDAVSLCSGVKVNVSASILTTDASDVTTPRYAPSVEYLCCQDAGTLTALENARNADDQFNTIFMNRKNTILDTYTLVSSST